MTEQRECPMCEPGTCPGGAHLWALWEDGIYTREQYDKMRSESKDNGSSAISPTA